MALGPVASACCPDSLVPAGGGRPAGVRVRCQGAGAGDRRNGRDRPVRLEEQHGVPRRYGGGLPGLRPIPGGISNPALSSPGYHDNHIVIRWFWAAVERFNNEQRLRLLQVSLVRREPPTRSVNAQVNDGSSPFSS